MAELIGLLGGMPEPHGRCGAGVLAERLDSLDAESRQREAPGKTIAAIKSERVMLKLSELPPLGPPYGRA